MVSIGRKRVRGHSLRTPRAYDKVKVGVLPLILFVILVPFYLISRSLSGRTTTPSRRHEDAASRTCGLWLMESTFKPGEYGTYTSTPRLSAGERISEAEMLVPIIDVNKNEWSPWQDYVAHNKNISRDLQLDNLYLSDVFVPGFESLAMANMVQCSDELANVEAERNESQDSGAVHRSSHATAGSFTYHYNYGYQSKQSLLAGEELLMPCSSIRSSTTTEPLHHQRSQVPVPLETLFERGVCIDNLSTGPSTLPGIGRGAFTKDAIQKGEPVTSTPLIHFDRSQMEIVAQTYSPVPSGNIREHGITYTDKTAGQQLLLNYCYSHPYSNVLLLPLGPSVNYINHAQDRTKANAVMSAPYMSGSASNGILTARPALVVDVSWYGLTADIVALRDIGPGEEIFIDYGDAWVVAWDEHVQTWKPTDEGYIAAHDYRRIHKGARVRTVHEQESEPYGNNVKTACFFTQHGGEVTDRDCLRPCDIMERTETGMDTRYSATVYPMESATAPDHCGNISTEGFSVEGLAWDAVQVVDASYSTDSHLGSAFRHEIGMSTGTFPQSWMAADPKPMGDFIASTLKAGELSAVRWKDTGEVVAPNAYRLGIDARVGATLLDYCDRMGITELLRTATVEGNSQAMQSTTGARTKNGDRWFLQRPSKGLMSNMHWLSPGDERTHQSYLQTLGAAGFDDLLKSIGESLGMSGLAAFHLSFIAVSHCSKGGIFFDVKNTGNKTLNVIIPLILAEEPGPEQELVDRSNSKIGRIINSYDTALLVGDDAGVSLSVIHIDVNTCVLKI
jgi:hypothetical protein